MAFLVLVSALVILGITVYSGSSAIFFSLFSFYILWTTICFKTGDKAKIQKDLLVIFNIAFFVYILYALVTYLAFAEFGDFYIRPDQAVFYKVGEDLGKNQSISGIFIDCFIKRIHIEQEGAYFLFGILAYFANTFFDGNSVLFQIINVAFFGILINLVVYKILLFYVRREMAFWYSICFVLFSHILSNSPWILRDIHIAFFYTVAIYIVHLPFSLPRLAFLIFLQIITIEFRLEHGIAFSFFSIIYTYAGASNSKYRKVYYVLIPLFLILLVLNYINIILSSITEVTNTLTRYTVHTEESAEDSGGLGAALLKLPVGIRQIASLGFSQLLPFPPWSQLDNSKSFFQGIIATIAGLAPVFWGYVIFTVACFFKNIYKRIPKLALWLLAFTVIFLIANSANLTLRRIIPVYPVIYVFFVFTHSQLSKRRVHLQILKYAGIYSVLLLLYLIMKYI